MPADPQPQVNDDDDRSQSKSESDQSKWRTPTEAYESANSSESDELPQDVQIVDRALREPRGFKWPQDEKFVPRQLGGFCLISLKAWGGFGGIFEAEQLSLARTVAVKVVIVETGESRDLARNEARVLGQVHHSHLLPIFDSGEDQTSDGRPLLWFAMRLVPGVSLMDVLDFTKQTSLHATRSGSLASVAGKLTETSDGGARR